MLVQSVCNILMASLVICCIQDIKEHKLLMWPHPQPAAVLYIWPAKEGGGQLGKISG